VYWGLIFVRYYLVHGMTGIPARLYLLGVVAKTHIVGIMSAILPMVIYFQMSENIWRLIVVLISSLISSGVIIYLFGLDAAEKSFFNKKIFSKFKTFSNGN
jgi:VIT1/CCC1 family predicted Fe2+/Mn2+ transporter